mmetsp:Transcript_8754/g.18857  ORF Transcript_8754/g.18857 Transcript_8754/m.18857 type:complete len:822 (+) Transcript_8754:165-2630(+)
MAEAEGSNDIDSIFNLFCLGDSGVGKSSLVFRFVKDEFSNDPKYTATVGIRTKLFTKAVQIGEDDKPIKAQIWDIMSGDDNHTSVSSTHIKVADGVLLVYDVSDESSFRNIPSWLTAVDEHAKKDCLVMLVGNKNDLPDHSRMVSIGAGRDLAKKYGLAYIETSALTGMNVETAFHGIVQGCYNMQKGNPNESKPKTRKKNKKKKKWGEKNGEAANEGKAKKKEKKSKTNRGVSNDVHTAVSRRTASSLLAERKENKPKTISSNTSSGDTAPILSRRTASALLAERIQARHNKYKRRGKRGTPKVGLEIIEEGYDENNSALLMPKNENGNIDHGNRVGTVEPAKEEKSDDDLIIKLELGLGSNSSGNVDDTQIQDVSALEDQRTVPMGVVGHDQSSNDVPLPATLTDALYESMETGIISSLADVSPCTDDASEPLAQDGVLYEIKDEGKARMETEVFEIDHDDVMPEDFSTLCKEVDAAKEEVNAASDTSGLPQLKSSSESIQSSANPAYPVALPTGLHHELQRDCHQDQPNSDLVRSADSEESPEPSIEIVEKNPVPDESEVPVHDATPVVNNAFEGDEEKSLPPCWKRHLWCIIAGVILTVVVSVVGVLVVPRQNNDDLQSSTDDMVLASSTSPTAAAISETMGPTQQPQAFLPPTDQQTFPIDDDLFSPIHPAIASPTPTLSKDQQWTMYDDDVFAPFPSPTPTVKGQPCNGNGDCESGELTIRPTIESISATSISPSKLPTQKTTTPNPTRSPAKVIPPPCENDMTWRIQVGDKKRTCNWVSNIVSKGRCNRIGINGISSADACPEHCNDDCKSGRA